VPQEAVYCGQDKYCNPGTICVGTTQCITQSDAASQKDRADCASHDSNRSIDGCTRVLANESVSRSSRATTFFNRGVSHNNKGDYDRAVADYDQAIELNPVEASYYSNRGISLSSKGEHDRAIADFSQAIKLAPNGAQYYTLRGIAYQKRALASPQDYRDDLERANADYSTAIALPALPDAIKAQEIARQNLGPIVAGEAKRMPAEELANSTWNRAQTILSTATTWLTTTIAAILARPILLAANIAVILVIVLANVYLGRNRGEGGISRITPRTHHEAPKKEEPKKRKPTENVSQRSPFDRGYKY